MRTFLDVFPNATLWLDGELMVGSAEPLQVRRETVERALAAPASGELLRTFGLDSFDALDQWYTAGPREMRAFVGQGPLLTDDRPLLEYYRSLPSDHVPIDLSTLRGRFSDVLTD
jgi:spermidine synthase